MCVFCFPLCLLLICFLFVFYSEFCWLILLYFIFQLFRMQMSSVSTKTLQFRIKMIRVSAGASMKNLELNQNTGMFVFLFDIQCLLLINVERFFIMVFFCLGRTRSSLGMTDTGQFSMAGLSPEISQMFPHRRCCHTSETRTTMALMTVQVMSKLALTRSRNFRYLVLGTNCNQTLFSVSFMYLILQK